MENSNYKYSQQVDLPNSTLILVLGIISIVGCCASYGIVGFICGVISLFLASSSNKLYYANPEKYTESSFKNINTGKTCAWIGLIPSIILIIVGIIFITTVGLAGIVGALGT